MEIRGLTEAKEALDALNVKVQRKIVRKATKEGAKIVLVAAKAESPVRTGFVKNSIQIRPGKSKKGSVHIGVGIAAKDYVGDAFYGAFLIYGHKIGKRPKKAGVKNIFGSWSDKRKEVPPNNFLLRAYDATKEKAAAAIAQSILDQIGFEGGE